MTGYILPPGTNSPQADKVISIFKNVDVECSAQYFRVSGTIFIMYAQDQMTGRQILITLLHFLKTDRRHLYKS